MDEQIAQHVNCTTLRPHVTRNRCQRGVKRSAIDNQEPRPDKAEPGKMAHVDKTGSSAFIASRSSRESHSYESHRGVSR
jgi:hypothetical protein